MNSELFTIKILQAIDSRQGKASRYNLHRSHAEHYHSDSLDGFIEYLNNALEELKQSHLIEEIETGYGKVSNVFVITELGRQKLNSSFNSE